MIYLDNAATTWPKPEETILAMEDCIRNKGANPGRGGHQMALAAGKLVLETRELLAGLFNIRDSARIAFTGNATESINLALKGCLMPGDHVITTSMEHNAVARPLHLLENRGVKVTFVRCNPQGFLDPNEVADAIRDETKAVVMTHASNVTGTIMPVEEIGRVTKANQIMLIVDAAQTAGFLDIDVETLNIDLLAFAGHKSLYGPQGTGGLYIRPGLDINPLKEGGTGSKSELLDQPKDMPDRYESGTPNTPGIAGLGAGISFVLERGLKQIREHERNLMARFIEGAQQIKELEIYGPQNPSLQVPVVAVNVKGHDPSEVAFVMDKAFKIACRSGLHCSPMAHKTIGTLDRGTLRFSFGVFNNLEEIEQTLEALEQTIEEL